jgi:hypothetical protein
MSMSRSSVVRSHAAKKSAFPPLNEKALAELSVRFGLPAGRLKLAVQTAQRLPAETVDGVARWVDVLAGVEAKRRQEWIVSIAVALETLAQGIEDPLAVVDEPMTLADRMCAHVQADHDVEVSRSLVLSESVSAEEAAENSGRSRQNLEAMRRKGQALALRVGQQWRYPVWQFDRDGVGGIVTGLREVLAALRMSPAGTALWLIQPCPLLKGARPIELLRRGRTQDVVQVAEELGHTP